MAPCWHVKIIQSLVPQKLILQLIRHGGDINLQLESANVKERPANAPPKANVSNVIH